MVGVQVEEVPAARWVEARPERVAVVGRLRRASRRDPVEVATTAGFEESFGSRDSALRRATEAYLAQGGDPLLVVAQPDLTEALTALASADPSPTLLVVAPPLLRGREAEVHAWCVAHRCLLLVESRDGTLPGGLGRNAAAYTPRLGDPAGRGVWTSAAVAGVIRRLDRTRGLWRAPAGLEAEVVGLTAGSVGAPAVTGAPAPPAGESVNPIRTAPDGRLVVWGARTAATAGEAEWRYVPVRRLALSLERSLTAGLGWAVSEPNGEALWAQVRAVVSEHLDTLWRAGAFPAGTADEAYVVRCDRTTMTQSDLDAGRLICLVGIAPTRPAEFIIIRIEQLTASAS